MPELPEVETIRRQLAPELRGKRIENLFVLDPKWGSPVGAAELRSVIEGRTIGDVGRRGKYLIFDLGDELSLICHLRMTGNFLYDADPEVQYQRAVFELEGGHALRFTDPRRFGTAEVIAGEPALDRYFAGRLGIEPFSGELDGTALRGLAAGRRTPIKAFLLDQRQIAGIGNIYADEALFRASIHPMREAGRLTKAQYDLLAVTIVEALQAGLDAGGATIDDFRHSDGLYGGFQNEFLVHRRAGEPCPRCGTEIRKTVVAGRGTYTCDACQKRPRGTKPRSAVRRASRSGQRP
ncbi:MAG: bifunctional DNA-formamidopyrimidine glycosylase/DNA-(apurinic or apyrimidinic site) lyase [Actinobacteria bacterium]|uniref:Unannotated protein n=1 Tax=freshwater metagenome TaxID=449393 RepID=A0A6J5ZUN3_9ZZZZ|nr:bifunctional DNA-formamidopyrimidine glycosylase/DNA-(apurinic or apyrimidinic site) lyase [Actinomycetota bacterium]